jgi:hypothetical protein
VGITEHKNLNSGAGIEYGAIVSVRENGEQKESRTFVYRDSYHTNHDDYSKNFKTIKDIIVKEDTGEIIVIASAKDYAPMHISFSFQSSDEELPALGQDELQKRKEIFE